MVVRGHLPNKGKDFILTIERTHGGGTGASSLVPLGIILETEDTHHLTPAKVALQFRGGLYRNLVEATRSRYMRNCRQEPSRIWLTDQPVA